MLATLDGTTCNVGVHPHTPHELQEEAGMCYSICKKMGNSRFPIESSKSSKHCRESQTKNFLFLPSAKPHGQAMAFEMIKVFGGRGSSTNQQYRWVRFGYRGSAVPLYPKLWVQRIHSNEYSTKFCWILCPQNNFW